MMAACLNSTSALSIAPETHFFDDLRLRVGSKTPLDAAARAACEGYFLALAQRPYGHGGDPLSSPIDRERLTATAVALGGAADHYFEAFCRICAQDDAKERWGEKTPRHVFRVDELLAAFPGAQVLCMVRDPRAVVASYRNWRAQPAHAFDSDNGYDAALDREWRRVRRSYHPALLALLWRGAVLAARRAAARHGAEHVRLVRYEDLVSDPERTADSLGRWLGVDVASGLRTVGLVNSSYAPRRAGTGVVRASVDRWVEALPRAHVAVVEQVCGPLMSEFGYHASSRRPTRGAVASTWAALPVAGARAAVANRARVGRPVSYLTTRVLAR
jgi:hypothetical protein